MSTPLERVRKLLALATSPAEEEARTAALAAVRMIAKHGFVVVDARDAAPRAVPTSTAARPTRWAGPRAFTSKYDGICVHCDKRYWEGDRILWSRGVGTTHAACDAFWKRAAA